ncbi:MAG TPA: hypothetical protein ENH11_01905, partial [Candidatus Acetothermia bacterium]|nr:hypothetical protein [Candidatus Acetothermia bacterium]
MWLGSPSKKTLIAMLMTGAALAAVSIAIYLGGFAAQSHRQTMPFLVGVNLAGAEFGPDKEQDGPRGVFGTEYTYPIADLTPGYESPAYFLAKGMNTFRLPVRWERLQYELGKPLDKDELARLALTVKKLGELDAWVILDLHNFGRYEGTLIGT